MNTRLFAFVASLAAVAGTCTSLYGQYPGFPSQRVQPGLMPGGVVQAPFTTQAPYGMQAPGMVMPAAFMGGGGADPGCAVGGCAAGCADGGCAGKCDGGCGGGCSDCCLAGGGFANSWHYYGEFLYLRARDSEVAWAEGIDGPIVAPPVAFPIQIRPIAVLDQDFQTGWKAGFQYNATECTGISAQYTMFEATTNDRITIAAPNVIRSLISHPGTATAAQNFLEGRASYNINYDMIDIDYHKLLWYDCDYQVGVLTGVNFVQMEQGLRADFVGGGVASETVITDIDFYGAGLRFGLQGEFQASRAWRGYAKGIGSLVAGEFRANYTQNQAYDPNVIDTGWRAGRVIGIWNLETGLKWTSRCGYYSANVGYVFSAWTNAVQTDQWIHGVRTNNFIGMDDTMTFDGLVARFEARF